MDRNYSVETSFSGSGPWAIIDAFLAPSLINALAEANKLVPDRRCTWVRLVPNDCEEDATILKPTYR